MCAALLLLEPTQFLSVRVLSRGVPTLRASWTSSSQLTNGTCENRYSQGGTKPACRKYKPAAWMGSLSRLGDDGRDRQFEVGQISERISETIRRGQPGRDE